MKSATQIYEVRPRKDRRGFNLISERLPFDRLWYVAVTDAVDYAKFYVLLAVRTSFLNRDLWDSPHSRALLLR